MHDTVVELLPLPGESGINFGASGINFNIIVLRQKARRETEKERSARERKSANIIPPRINVHEYFVSRPVYAALL